MAGRRVHHQARGLVDDQQVLVLIDNIEGNFLGLPAHLGFRLGIQRQAIIQHHFVPRLSRLTIHRQRAAFDPGLQAGTGVFGHQFGSGLVKAPITQFRRHNKVGDDSFFR